MATFDLSTADLTDLTFVISNSGDASALFHKGERVDSGHTSDLMERIVETLIHTEFVADLVVDHEARGWAGIATKLSDLGL